MSSQLNQIQPPQLLSQTNKTTDPTITLNNLNKLLIGVTIAQSRGAYSFDESADLAQPVKSIAEFIKFYTTNLQEEQQKGQGQGQIQEQAQAQAQDQQPIINSNREDINLSDLN
jgi:hypothetical protein